MAESNQNDEDPRTPEKEMEIEFTYDKAIEAIEEEKLKKMFAAMKAQIKMNDARTTRPPEMSAEEKADSDARSIWIGNVDYSVTAQELETYFIRCGAVNRITIPADKFSGKPKGFAYLEFADKVAVDLAMTLNDTCLRGRKIQVTRKRTNLPGVSSTNRPSRGRPFQSHFAAYHYAPPSRVYRGRGGYSRTRRPQPY